MRADARFRLGLVVRAHPPSCAPSEPRTDRSVTTWCRSRLLPCAALALSALAAAACTTGGIPILAPGEARLGATALVFVDTNGIPNGDLYEHYDISRDNVTLGIEDEAGVQVFAPRAVVGVQDLRTAETVPNDILKGAGAQVHLNRREAPGSFDVVDLGLPSVPSGRRLYDVELGDLNLDGAIDIVIARIPHVALDAADVLIVARAAKGDPIVVCNPAAVSP